MIQQAFQKRLENAPSAVVQDLFSAKDGEIIDVLNVIRHHAKEGFIIY